MRSSFARFRPVIHRPNTLRSATRLISPPRLQQLAGAGSTIISDSTRKLVEGYFSLLPRGPARVKGIHEALNVFEVSGLGPLRTRLERSAGRGLSKFVGRDEEKEEFRKALEESKVGKGQVLAVEAEPGVGKSRLFLEFKTEANSDWALAEGFSVSHGKNSVLLPIIDLLHSYLGIEHGDAASLRRAKLAAKIGAADGPLQSELLYLCSLLEIDEDKDKLAAMDPELRRVRTHQAIIRMFISELKRRPLILIVEDLHWLDDESQALLDRLVNSIESAKILLLVNYRPEYSAALGR